MVCSVVAASHKLGSEAAGGAYSSVRLTLIYSVR